MRSTLRGRLALLLAFAPLLSLAVAHADRSSGTRVEQVKVGVLEPTSGPDASAGTDARNGAQFAADIINGSFPDLALPLAGKPGLPGLGGAKLAIVHADTKGDPRTGAREAQRLVTHQGAVALTGAYHSAVTKTASERAERLRIPFVNGDSSSTALTQRGLGYFFRTGPSDLTYGRTFFSLIEDRRAAGVRISSVGILHIDNEYGNDGAAITRQLARQHGLTTAADVAYDATSADLVPYVQKVRARKPDVLFVLSYTTDALLLQKAFTRLGYLPPAVLGYGGGFSDPRFVAGPARAADAQGFLRRTAWAAQLADRNPTAKKVAQKFAAKFGAPMTENSARTFTAVMTLAVAISEARSTDPEKIRSALRNVTLSGRDLIMEPWDYVRFDASGQNTGARGVVEQFVGGQWSVVYPNDLRSRRVVWPIFTARDRRQVASAGHTINQ
ncbi:ABC transporter substrate-binding protein [Streptomyces sp. Li-HN-5-11]|uniref:ABC transporter substrate-binding protein n=1 Tax=Streptomyces sp. Li-HN-5-11 TaxID=3075432 RepID=UPI0028A87541|nr:ABC transporter substrate-binding protein [Streptomyces sp. Li-HN-5-11]WNM34953.1 ABC transporter substrate-binding protein [Streptomyces sp. Li-HN-5-11]